MKRRRGGKSSNSVRWFGELGAISLSLAFLAGFLCVRSVRAQTSTSDQAEAQYQKAEQMRQDFEATPEQSRSLEDYKKLVAAYRRVYLLSSSAGAVTPALMEVAQLYHDMGDQFDQAYYQNSLVTYKFLIAQYPGSKFRTDALFEVGKIEKENLGEGAEAKDAFTQFIELYPHSPRVTEAREALKEIAEGELQAPQSTAQSPRADSRNRNEPSAAANDSANAERNSAARVSKTAEVTPQEDTEEAQSGPAKVTAIRTWNADDYTRVVVDLNGAVKYESARIKNPDRIYFDLYTARLAKTVTDKEMPIQNGFLKSVRVAQNKEGVVRLVLDVESIEGYSAFLLPDPYRLVIDVHGATETASNSKTPPALGIGRLAGDAPASAPATTAPAASEKVQVPVTRSPATAVDDNAPMNSAGLNSPTARQPRTLPVPIPPAVAARPTSAGDRSLTRTLGLKINRIVIDPGHGGHDTGTIGPHGLMEKNVCLDVALRLGRLIHKKLPGAEVIYTRKTDVFVPLEERTAIANQAKADLFISIHANASHDEAARGIETYYLSFTTSQEALETASRENALSDESVHQLQDLIKQIASNDKIEESHELASDIQTSLTGQLREISTAERNRGVKKAPFVVLIGADMPSVLAEISFLSNPTDERLLERPSQRQRIAQGIFRGVERYLSSLNSLAIDRQKPKLMTVQQPDVSGSSREQR